MEKDYSLNETQAVVACLEDAVVFKAAILELLDLPELTISLISLGFISEAAMFIVESYDCLKIIAPDKAAIFDSTLVDELRIMRHRAKLLESRKDINEVIEVLLEIEKNETKRYREERMRGLSFIFKLIQPDMGLTKLDGKIITSTHSTIYFLSPNMQFSSEYMKDLGEKVAIYIRKLSDLASSKKSVNIIDGKFLKNEKYKVFDIKSKNIIKRSSFQSNNNRYARALLLILTRLNYTKLVTSNLLDSDSHALLRTKFINTFHAVSSLKTLQAIIRKEGSLALENDFFKEVCSEENAKWISKQSSLRNFLTHYLLDEKQLKRMKPDFNREDAIYTLGGEVAIDEIIRRLDFAIENITANIEKFFNLKQDTFQFNIIEI
ncbi:hypothetical protein [uncultured Psychrobacter sp.]|uniref:hypothetical protein n=1 Tax=uncultured Psychrobacter sp. TaxID=259303 RepID=UPI00345A7DF7